MQNPFTTTFSKTPEYTYIPVSYTHLDVYKRQDGSYSYYREIRAYVPSYLLGGTIDTTGAGDTFCGSVLNLSLIHIQMCIRDRALLVFFDVIVMMLSEEMGISKEEMEARHRNIE